ncbi:unnamed protein product [Angiostrongylus costaricensis]|uniref:Uncharacterized protein n=1 Tax=Angiostrongylus costaricensis TaxID=334426 RepID=A0A0R3PUR3_ANGCS|nr:unnamed protein product [Angiostrongylus costaricensis]
MTMAEYSRPNRIPMNQVLFIGDHFPVLFIHYIYIHIYVYMLYMHTYIYIQNYRICSCV